MGIINLFFFVIPLCTGLAQVRVSLLNETQTLENTAELLRKNGCREDSIQAYKMLVQTYNAYHTLDVSQYPPATNGTYFFQTVDEFLQSDIRVARSLWSCSVNCLSQLVLLFNGSGFGTHDHEMRQPSYTCMAMPDTYRAVHRMVNPLSLDADIVIGLKEFGGAVSLWKTRMVDRVKTGADYPLTLANAVAGEWKNEQLQWDNEMDILSILCAHEDTENELVIFKKYHYGTLLYDQNQLILLEKHNYSGPFLRIDFPSEAALAEYAIKGTLKDPGYSDPDRAIFNNSIFTFRNAKLLDYHIPLPNRREHLLCD